MKAILYNGVNDYKYSNNVLEPIVNDFLNVKLKVEYCGICGSDIHKLLYEKPNKDYVKTNILGHEIVGTVIEIGNNVNKVRIGDKVVVEPLIYCNNCDMCKKGYIQFCSNIKSLGRDFQGGFAEYIVANEQQLYKTNKYNNLKKNALSDPYAVAIHIKNSIEQEKCLKVAIIGDGIIGMACADILCGSNEVVVFGKHNNRAEILNKINVKYFDINAAKEYKDYFDITIEAVGGRQAETLKDAIHITNKKCQIIVAGVYDNNFRFDISMRNAFYKELNIIGCNSFEKENNISEFGIALKYIQEKSKIADELISKTFNIKDFSKAVDYIKNRKANNCIKIMIKMGEKDVY